MDNDSFLDALHSRVYPVQQQLHEAFQAKEIPQEWYFKALVQIAYEYAVAGYSEEAHMIVLQVAPDYFRKVVVAQMHEDPAFFKQATLVAETVQQATLTPTQRASTCVN